MTRRSFGNARVLPSGRWQVRYRALGGAIRTAPSTDATKREATRFLAQVEADLSRGEWRDPRAGRITFREWSGVASAVH